MDAGKFLTPTDAQRQRRRRLRRLRCFAALLAGNAALAALAAGGYLHPMPGSIMMAVLSARLGYRLGRQL